MKGNALNRVFLFSIANVIVSAVATLALMAFFNTYPPVSALSSDVFPEWQFMLRPEREMLFYRFFVFFSILLQVAVVMGLRGALAQGQALPKGPNTCRGWRYWEWGVLLGVVCFIIPPDINMILSRNTDFFYHMDNFIMACGWASISGLTLNTDIISEYSILIPEIIGRLLTWFSHFNYTGVMGVMVAAGCVYYCMFYVLLRTWLGSVTVAIIGLAAGMCFQMFHLGVFPIVWQFPSATVLRFFWDMPVLCLILAHINSGRRIYLWAAAFFVGLSLVWTVDIGAYLLGTFLVYITADAYRQRVSLGEFCSRVGKALAMVMMTAVLILWAVQRGAVFTADFWHNEFEYVSLFMQGWGGLPITSALEGHHVAAFTIGLLIPVFYVWSLIFVGALCLLRRIAWDNVMVCVVAVYGLGLYHYYVARSGPTSYAVVCLPAVALGAWFLSKGISRVNALTARLMLLAIAVSLTGIFWNNPLLRDYPGLWNIAAQHKRFPDWQQAADLSQDVALIQRMTTPEGRVPLMSSFEVKMLIDAGRKPYFYYFPLFHSDAMGMLQFRGSYLHTHSRMAKTLRALQEDKPPYIFVEKKFFLGRIPKVYYERFDTLRILMAYAHMYYEPVAQGKYLLALKRKGEGI